MSGHLRHLWPSIASLEGRRLPVMRITLVRHGETVGESSVRYYGITDVALSDTGREQMRCVRAALDGARFGAIFTSRLRRSIEAASVIAPGQPSPTPIAGFDEVNFGRWEGWSREEIAARDPLNYVLWQERRQAFTYPEGESRDVFHARVAKSLGELVARCAHAHVLMVLHKGVIGVILTELLQLGVEERARLAIELGSIHVVARGDGDTWRAEVLDRVDHLGAALAAGR
jgi:broad specificity phosphatase PhoE